MPSFLRKMMMNCDEEVDKSKIPLTLTAAVANTSIRLKQKGTLPTIQYRTNFDNLWKDYMYDSEIILDVDQYVQFKGNSSFFSSSSSIYGYFVINGKVKLSGEVTSLINFSNEVPSYCFTHLFHNCDNYYSYRDDIVSYPSLSATKVANEGYSRMFMYQRSISGEIYLKATEVGGKAYSQMFYCNQNLQKIRIKKLTPSSNFEMCFYCFKLNEIEVIEPSEFNGRWLYNAGNTAEVEKKFIIHPDSIVNYGEDGVPSNNWNIMLNTPGILIFKNNSGTFISDSVQDQYFKFLSSEDPIVEMTNYPNYISINKNYWSTHLREYYIRSTGEFLKVPDTNNMLINIKTTNFEKSCQFPYKFETNNISITKTEYKQIISGDVTTSQKIEYSSSNSINISATCLTPPLPNGVTLTENGYLEFDNSIIQEGKTTVKIKLESKSGYSNPDEKDILINIFTPNSVLNDESLTFYEPFNDASRIQSGILYPELGNPMTTQGNFVQNEIDSIGCFTFPGEGNDRIVNDGNANYWTLPSGQYVPNITVSFYFNLHRRPTYWVDAPGKNPPLVSLAGELESLYEGGGIFIYTEDNDVKLEFEKHYNYSLGTIELNKWYHVAFTSSKNTVYGYLNGVLKKSNTRNYKNLASYFLGVNARKRLGGTINQDYFDENGYVRFNNNFSIAKLRIYNRNFSNQEISILANEIQI